MRSRFPEPRIISSWTAAAQRDSHGLGAAAVCKRRCARRLAGLVLTPCGCEVLMGVWLVQAPASHSRCRHCRQACSSMTAAPRRRPAARRPAACSMARPAGSGAVLAGLPAWPPRRTRSDAAATWGPARCGYLHAPPRTGCVPALRQRGRSLRLRVPAHTVSDALSLHAWL